MPAYRIGARCLLSSIGALLLASCGEANVPLPNEFRFVELSRGNGAIVTANGDFAVYPNVVEFDVDRSLVFGKRELATDNSDGSSDFTRGLGYFVLDTQSGELRQGLNQREMEAFR